MILPGHDSAFLLRIDSHPSKSVKSVVKFSSFLPSHLPFAWFAYFAVKNIRVHPAPSVVKNSGTIGVPADGSRTSPGRVSDGFDPHDRSAKCGGGRVDG